LPRALALGVFMLRRMGFSPIKNPYLAKAMSFLNIDPRAKALGNSYNIQLRFNLFIKFSPFHKFSVTSIFIIFSP